jgi:hypothetical protein
VMVKNGRAIFSESHWGIDYQAIKSKLKSWNSVNFIIIHTSCYLWFSLKRYAVIFSHKRIALCIFHPNWRSLITQSLYFALRKKLKSCQLSFWVHAPAHKIHFPICAIQPHGPEWYCPNPGQLRLSIGIYLGHQ